MMFLSDAARIAVWSCCVLISVTGVTHADRIIRMDGRQLTEAEALPLMLARISSDDVELQIEGLHVAQRLAEYLRDKPLVIAKIETMYRSQHRQVSGEALGALVLIGSQHSVPVFRHASRSRRPLIQYAGARGMLKHIQTQADLDTALKGLIGAMMAEPNDRVSRQVISEAGMILTRIAGSVELDCPGFPRLISDEIRDLPEEQRREAQAALIHRYQLAARAWWDEHLSSVRLPKPGEARDRFLSELENALRPRGASEKPTD